MLNFNVYWNDWIDEETVIDTEVIPDDEVGLAPDATQPFPEYAKKEFIGILRFESSATDLLQSLMDHEDNINGDGGGEYNLLYNLLCKIVCDSVKLGFEHGKNSTAPE